MGSVKAEINYYWPHIIAVYTQYDMCFAPKFDHSVPASFLFVWLTHTLGIATWMVKSCSTKFNDVTIMKLVVDSPRIEFPAVHTYVY